MAESAVFLWEGTDKQGKKTKGEITSSSPSIARAELRRQGIVANKVRKKSAGFSLTSGGSVKPADIALFTRQMATMMRAGVPLVQAFDIVADGLDKPKVSELVRSVRNDVSGGSSFAAALRRHPLYFGQPGVVEADVRQALVVRRSLRPFLVGVRAVGQRGLEQRRIPEAVSQRLLDS